MTKPSMLVRMCTECRKISLNGSFIKMMPEIKKGVSHGCIKSISVVCPECNADGLSSPSDAYQGSMLLGLA